MDGATLVGGHTLPAPLTSFVGRQAEIARVGESLGATRLLTLTGPGGVGQSRLALEVARGTRGTFPDDVWLVELAPRTVAAGLGLSPRPRQPLLAATVPLMERRAVAVRGVMRPRRAAPGRSSEQRVTRRRMSCTRAFVGTAHRR